MKRDGLFLIGFLLLSLTRGMGQLCAPPPGGVLGWWPAEGTADDLVGGNAGTPIGNATYTSGMVGQAFSLDGNGSAFVLSNTAALQLQNFTIEAWVQRTSSSVVTSDFDGDGVIFSYGSGGYGFGMNNDGDLFLSRIDVDSVMVVTAFNDSGFHHVAVAKSGTNVVFYLDGASYPAPSSYLTQFTFSTTPAIGTRPDALRNCFIGVIDEVSVYNRALLPEEILAIYQAGGAGKCSGPSPPSITAQPTDQVAPAGGIANFMVVAAGSPPLAYQWVFAATNLVASTNSALILTNVQAANEGGYEVVVTNAFGAVTSTVALLSLQTPPFVNEQPRSVTNRLGTTALFVVGASGTPPLSFQWQWNGVELSGETRYFLAITNVQATNVGPYAVEIVNAYGAITSAPALLQTLLPPTLTAQPESQVVPTGANPVFNVTASGAAPLSFRWYFAGASLPGATNAILPLNDVRQTNAGFYSVVVSNIVGSITSSNALLTVTNPLCEPAPGGLVGWWQAEDSPADAVTGGTGVLVGSVTYTAGKVGQAFNLDGSGSGIVLSNGLALQLQDFTIEGWARRASSSIATHDSDGNGLVFGYGSGGYGFAVNNRGDLVLTKIGSSQVSLTNAVTDTNFHHLAVTKSSTNVFFYVDGVGYPAAPYSTIFSFNSQPSVGLRYDARKNSFLGQIDEISLFNRALAPAEIQSLYYATRLGKCPTPLAWISQPTNQTITVGGTALFSAMVAGSRPITYQWYQNDAGLTGATSSALTISKATFFQAGAYTLSASNSTGGINSSNATLIVHDAPLLRNGSFETGDAAGWVLANISSPFEPWAVRGAGYSPGYNFFLSAPTDGNYCLTAGFDGGGPGRVRAALDVLLPLSPATLTFSYRLAWDMQNFGATQPRTFGVTIEPFGGGTALQSQILLTANPGTVNYDTGDEKASIDLSAFYGRAIRISFDAIIPEYFTGPGFLQLDNVALSYQPMPPLIISRFGSGVALSWPAAFSNFTAIAATNLSTPPINWSPIPTNSISFGATNNALTLPASGGDTFFRLRSL